MTITEHVERVQNEIRELDARVLKDVIAAYEAPYRTLQEQYERLAAEIEAARAAGVEVSPSWLYRQERYQALLAAIENEVRIYSDAVAGRLSAAQVEAIRLAAEHVQAAVAQQRPGLVLSFASLNRLATEAAIAATQPDSPVGQLLASLAPAAVNEARAALVTGVALGWNPRRTRKLLQQALGVPLARALRIARTETMRAYRHAHHELFRENADIVKGWRWLAAKNTRTCAGCLMMDGREFPIDRVLNDHPNGRCTLVPVTRSWKELGLERPRETSAEAQQWETGEQWLRKQPYDVRLRVLRSETLVEAYRARLVRRENLYRVVDHPVWGKSVVANTVRGALSIDYERARQMAQEARARRLRDPDWFRARDMADRIAGALAQVWRDPLEVRAWRGRFDVREGEGWLGLYDHRNGTVVISRRVVNDEPVLFATTLHELMHVLSEGVGESYSQYKGIEEGMAEQMQRILRPRVLRALGLPAEWDDIAKRHEADHPYNLYIYELDKIRSALNMDWEPFLNLLYDYKLSAREFVIRREFDRVYANASERTRDRVWKNIDMSLFLLKMGFAG